ncbi:PAS domain-containing protein [Vibrio olivae]
MNNKAHQNWANSQLPAQPNSSTDTNEVSDLSGFPLSGAELDLLMDNHFKHLVDVFNDGIFYMADCEQMFYYNPTFYAQFGIQSGHTSFQKWLELVHPEDRLLLQRRVALHTSTEGKRLSTEYRVKRTDGQYIWVQGTAVTRIKDDQRFLIGCHRDISDKKKPWRAIFKKPPLWTLNPVYLIPTNCILISMTSTQRMKNIIRCCISKLRT